MRMLKRYFVLSMILAGGLAVRGQDDGINWLGNYQEALRLARQTQKPIFLEFRCEA